jgi:hypothetical protein
MFHLKKYIQALSITEQLQALLLRCMNAKLKAMGKNKTFYLSPVVPLNLERVARY